MAVWNFENAAHLLRRACFGGTNAEIQAFLQSHSSVSDAVDDILSFTGSNKRPPTGGRDFYKAKLKQKQWWLKTMLKATSPRDALREKMTLYWHGHLCSGFIKQPEASYMATQNGLFRRYAGGNFRELVRDFNRDPANLYYLDGISNYATDDGIHVNANENFGREVMELFTLGISQLKDDGSNDPAYPNYTEGDVHQLARALTGWVNIEKNVGVWQSYAWDGGQFDDNGDDMPDPITIFGVQNNNFKIGADVAGTADDVLKLIFSRTDSVGNVQAAMHLCVKLWTYFAYPPPVPGLKTTLAGFAATLVASDFEVIPVLRAMFNSEEFYSDTAKTRTVRNPVDYMIGQFRALGVKSDGKTLNDSEYLVDMLADMGMELFEPPNVAGWPGGKRWITTGTLVSRLDFSRLLAEADAGKTFLDISTIVPVGSSTTDPGTCVDAIIRRVGLDDADPATYQGGVALTSAQRTALLNFITDGGSKSQLDLSDASKDDARILVRGTIALVLQAAESQIF